MSQLYEVSLRSAMYNTAGMNIFHWVGAEEGGINNWDAESVCFAILEILVQELIGFLTADLTFTDISAVNLLDSTDSASMGLGTGFVGAIANEGNNPMLALRLRKNVYTNSTTVGHARLMGVTETSLTHGKWNGTYDVQLSELLSNWGTVWSVVSKGLLIPVVVGRPTPNNPNARINPMSSMSLAGVATQETRDFKDADAVRMPNVRNYGQFDLTAFNAWKTAFPLSKSTTTYYDVFGVWASTYTPAPVYTSNHTLT